MTSLTWLTQNYQLVILLVFLFALTVRMIHRLLPILAMPAAPHSTPRPVPAKAPHPRALTFFLIGASIFILGRTVYNLGENFEWDEYNLGCDLVAAGFVNSINPFVSGQKLLASTNQTLANAASYVAIYWFGLSERTIRYPSVFFTSCFLIILGLFAHRNLSAFTLLLIYGHLITNGTFAFYAHSAKGYISSMAATVAMLGIVFGADRHRRPLTWVGFAVVAVLCILSHSISALWFLFWFFALCGWLTLNANQLTEQQRVSYRHVFWISASLIPFAGVTVYYHSTILRLLNDLLKGQVPLNPYLEGWRVVFGYSHTRLGQACFALIAALSAGLFAYRLSADGRRDFLTLFMATVLVLLTSLLVVLQPRIFNSRFLLVFLVPLLAWMGESIGRVTHPFGRRALMGASFALLVLGSFGGYGENIDYHSGLNAYRAFLKKVEIITSPISQNCYRFVGDKSHRSRWATEFFLPATATNHPSDCRYEYEIHFPADLLNRDIRYEAELPENRRATPLYRDPQFGGTLYRLDKM
jgi:hypothetical protein